MKECDQAKSDVRNDGLRSFDALYEILRKSREKSEVKITPIANVDVPTFSSVDGSFQDKLIDSVRISPVNPHRISGALANKM